MSDIDQWQAANNDYLSKAVQWIRLLLQQQVEQHQPEQKPQMQRFSWFSGTNQRHEALPASVTTDTTAQLEQELLPAETASHPPAMVMLRQRLGLSRFEQNILLLCAAIELDPQVADLCSLAQNDAQRN